MRSAVSARCAWRSTALVTRCGCCCRAGTGSTGSASTGGCSRAPICLVCHGPVVARVEGPDDAKEDCDGSESVERHGSGGIGFLPVAGGSHMLPAILVLNEHHA